ncbi:MAG: FAD:protein FMN transferase, partial [Oscillibacter sp.]|nr:FAD:protein FMN transferase [Oscillibacter sp.]
EAFAAKVDLQNTSCVTSGNYERFFTVGGTQYHHIIDQDTLFPADHCASITVITEDSGLADALSTALFCMPCDEGMSLLKTFDDVEVLWIFSDGTQRYTEGFTQLLSN